MFLYGSLLQFGKSEYLPAEIKVFSFILAYVERVCFMIY